MEEGWIFGGVVTILGAVGTLWGVVAKSRREAKAEEARVAAEAAAAVADRKRREAEERRDELDYLFRHYQTEVERLSARLKTDHIAIDKRIDDVQDGYQQKLDLLAAKHLDCERDLASVKARLAVLEGTKAP